MARNLHISVNQSKTIYTLTLHKFLSSSLAVMAEIVAFSGLMLDA
ncbi:hypothetical protein D1BOALGB6SA_5716 [Olavius sp. associated proteobacterium Delta 1]|nr:hypothetical protein D1BOALGB6SA_5716 [Olavius sp. associated proteobacterium Delta 1]